MKENVGPTDQAMRIALGPMLLLTGYAFMGGKNGRGAGLLTMIAGALVTETAVTRTCPLNALLGIDTTERAAAGWEEIGAERRQAPRTAVRAAETAEFGEEETEEAGRTLFEIDFDDFVNAASSLSFIRDEGTAEAAVKAVLGILASRLEEPEARRLVARLPEPLTYESLRGRQVNVTDLSVAQYYSGLASQFHITPDQAQVLAVTVLRLVKEALDAEGVREIERSLPRDWSDLLERV